MNGVWGLACSLNPSLKQAQEVGASPVQGKGGSLLPKHGPDRTRLCALAPATALSRHRLGSAKDKKQKEQMQRQMVGIVKGTSCPCPQIRLAVAWEVKRTLPNRVFGALCLGRLLSLQAISNVTHAEERSAHLGHEQGLSAQKPFRPQSSSEV